MLKMWTKLNKYNKIGLFFIRKSNHLNDFQSHLTKSFCSLNYKSKYTPEEINKILTTVNEKSCDELLSYNISKGRILKIDMWRQKFGNFKNIEEMLELDGFGIKILEKFCESVLEESNNINIKRDGILKSRSISGMTVPNITESQRKNIRECVSIHVGISHITWSHFEVINEKPITLLDWSYFEIEDKKLHLFELVNFILQLNRLIPMADIYILENPQVAQPGAPGTVLQVNINIQKSQLVSMISVLLANRSNLTRQTIETEKNEEDTDKFANPTVIYLKRFISSRLFGLLVGNEKISSESVILSLLRTHVNTEDIETSLFENMPSENPTTEKVAAYLNVAHDLRMVYSNSTNVQKELMGQSLLMGLAFIQLCILKCPLSLEKVRR